MKFQDSNLNLDTGDILLRFVKKKLDEFVKTMS